MDLQILRPRWLAPAALLLAALLMGCVSDSGDDDDNGGNGGANTAASMTARVNDYRSGAGQPDLLTDSTLQDVAQAQAEYNASNNINTDTNGAGQSIAEQLRDAGYDFSTVAYLFNNLSEAASFSEWTANAAYRGIMLDPTYDDIGVGTAVSSGGTRRWVVVFAAKDVATSGTVEQMLNLLNDFRADGGAAAFTLNDNLMIVAQAQAEHNAQVQANEAASGGVGLADQVEDTGYSHGILMWTLANGGPQESVTGWTNTPDEVDLMLDARFEEIGIGVASGGTKQWWVVLYAQPAAP